MLKKRQKEILSILEKTNGYLTVEYISQKIGVSKRTVHNEISNLEKYICDVGKFIEKKRGVGIKLSNLKVQEVNVTSKSNINDEYDIFNRRVQIMTSLLFDRKIVSFNQLSEKYMVSKTSIDKDLDFIMKILDVGSGIRLKSNVKGTRLIGTEMEFQKALLQFNRYILRNMQLDKHSKSYKDIEILNQYYSEEVVKNCKEVLYDYIRKNVHMITDYYVQNILNVFIILIFELKHGRHIENSNISRVSIENDFFDSHAESLLGHICSNLNYQYTKNDIQFFSENLILNRFDVFIEDKYKELSNSIINSISKSLKVKIDSEKELFSQLLEHIPLMIYRLKLNYKTENPFTEQIKTEFPLTFQNIWLSLSEYEERLDIKFNEDEIAFLTIYFQSAVERLKLNHKVLIVCQMGVATSELIKNRLRNILSSVDLIDVASVDSLKRIDYKKWDLIISTVELRMNNEKIIHVSPFLTEIDISKIKERLNLDSDNSNKLYPKNSKILPSYLSEETIFLNTNFSSKNELIRDICGYLLKLGKVKEQFIVDVENREQLGGTDLPSGVSVPHGNPNNVNDTTIVLIKNKKKFKWDKYYVDLVFLIAITRDDSNKTREILSDIYNIVKNTKFLQNIRKSNNVEYLINIFGE